MNDPDWSEPGPIRAAHPTGARIALGLLAFQAAILGLWAGFAPRSSTTSSPVSVASWVAADGPYNEHLVRDFGNMNLAMAVITVGAAVSLSPFFVRVVGAGWLVFTVAHFGYHVTNLDRYDTSDAVANVVSLGLAVVLPVVVVICGRPIRIRSTNTMRSIRPANPPHRALVRSRYRSGIGAIDRRVRVHADAGIQLHDLTGGVGRELEGVDPVVGAGRRGVFLDLDEVLDWIGIRARDGPAMNSRRLGSSFMLRLK